MHTNKTSFLGLRLLCLTCLLLLVPALAFFLVNLELAVRVLYPSFVFFEHLLPGAIYRAGIPLSADLSTISTLVPVLIFLFPLIQGARILRAGERAPVLLREMEADPYPPHFAFFLVMLGLVGTLYGMLIGLQTSGVASVGATSINQESVQVTLDRLIGGTATAILSSLVGIVAAFIVARPVPWLFRKLTGVEQEESRRTLTDTLAELTRDLQNLGAASRALVGQLPPGTLQNFRAQMDRLETGVTDTVRHLAPLAGHLQHLEENGNKLLAHTGRLESVEQTVRDQSARLDRLLEALQQLGTHTGHTNELLERQLAETREQQQALLQQLMATATAAQDSVRDGRTDRDALRRALAQYANAKE